MIIISYIFRFFLPLPYWIFILSTGSSLFIKDSNLAFIIEIEAPVSTRNGCAVFDTSKNQYQVI